MENTHTKETHPLSKVISRSILVLYKGEIEETEELQDFGGIDLEGREELEKSLTDFYKIKQIPCILAYGEVHSLEDIRAVKEKENIFNKKQLEAAIDTIKKNKRVIFIKGTPSKPECKFTREFVGMLKEEGLVEGRDYKSINVLESPAVREGIKEFGDWPTYPQIYINGSLAGGLDVIKAEKARGNIKACLGKE